MVIIGLLFFMWLFSKDMKNQQITEEDAIKAVFYYIYSDRDYDYASMVVPTMIQERLVYVFQTPDQKEYQHEILQGKGLTEDKQYYIFARYTQYERDIPSQKFYYEYRTDYAVNRETGEVLRERKWLLTDAGGELIYSKEYEKKVNQSYLKKDIPDGKMPEEEAAKTLFYYMYPDCNFDYDSMVVRTIQQKQSVYVYQTPGQKESYSVSKLCYKGLTEDKQYYIFADYTDYYGVAYVEEEIIYSHSEYLTDYAVNRETGEVLREREWFVTDTECELLYDEEYEKAFKQSNE